MTTGPDIYDVVADLCERLGLDPHNVRRLDVHRTEVIAEIYETDEKGSKFIREDGKVALNEVSFPVTTLGV